MNTLRFLASLFRDPFQALNEKASFRCSKSSSPLAVAIMHQYLFKNLKSRAYYKRDSLLRAFRLIGKACSIALLALLGFCGVADSSEQPLGAEYIQGKPESLAQFHLLYQSVLDDAVYSGEKNDVPLNLVDYASLRNDERLTWLMEFLEEFDHAVLVSKADRIAYFLNVYNIMAINKVCENWPLKSLRSLGSAFRPVWTHQCGRLNHERMTLRILEHDILRQQSEPRIHFALNCASVSCPDLRKEPYVGEKLEAQLREQTLGFFRQQGKGLKTEGSKLWLSPLLDWFAKDFDSVGGVDAFLEEYLPSPPESTEWELQGFLSYDWDVNCHLSGSEKRTLRLRSK